MFISRDLNSIHNISLRQTVNYIFTNENTRFCLKLCKFFFFFAFPLVHPVINVRNQLVGSPFEKDVTIECNVEASPKSINYWIKDIKDGKFNVV